MKTQLERKLEKLPACFKLEDCSYHLEITKFSDDETLENVWHISYKDLANNVLIAVYHKSIQAAVDNMLAGLKQLKIDYYL